MVDILAGRMRRSFLLIVIAPLEVLKRIFPGRGVLRAPSMSERKKKHGRTVGKGLMDVVTSQIRKLGTSHTARELPCAP